MPIANIEQMTVFTCLEIVIKAGVFEKLREKDNGMSAQELGEATGVDAGVIGQTRLKLSK